MEITTTTTTRRQCDGARRQEREPSAPWAERSWLQCEGELLDERAYLAALGRGGAQRMAVPLGDG